MRFHWPQITYRPPEENDQRHKEGSVSQTKSAQVNFVAGDTAPFRQVAIQPKNVLVVLSATFAFVAGIYVLLQLGRIALWILVAALLAVALDPFVRALQRRGLPRKGAVGIIALFLMSIMISVAVFIIPPLVSQAGELALEVPAIAGEMQKIELVQQLDERFDVVEKASKELEKLPTAIVDKLGAIAAYLFSGLLGALTILILAILFLLSGENLIRSTLVLVPWLAENERWQVIEGAYESVSRYLFGAFGVALVNGLAGALCLYLLGIDHMLPLAAWMGLTALVPMLGAPVGAIPALGAALLDEPWKAGVLFIYLFIYQQIENGIVSPLIMGRAVDLSPAIIFISLLVGGQIAGVVGALFAVPVAATIQIILRQAVAKKKLMDPHKAQLAESRLDSQDP